MKQMLQICCKNNNNSKEFPIGSSLLDIYYGFNLNFPYQVVSAKVNNRSEGLNFRVYNNKDVEFLDVRDSSGMRTYVRSLCFVLYKAVSELFPNGKLFVEHPVSKGYFCNLRIGRPVELEDVMRIKQRMQEIIENSHNNKEISNATKRKEKLQKQIKETKEYDAKIAHLALSRIDIDLDDGVKVNYEKVQTADGKKMQILAKI